VASLLIRKIDDRTKARLRVRAAEHGRSMEEEARTILAKELRPQAKTEREENLYEAIRRYVEPLRGFDLNIPAREPMRKLPDFK
jgi:plasmid stability protein